MYICSRCSDLEALALAPVGCGKVVPLAADCADEKVCFSCLGLLQKYATQKFIDELCKLIADQKFKHKYIRSSMVLPSCLYLRQLLIIRKAADAKATAVDLRCDLLKRLSYLKAAWRDICVPYIEKILGVCHIEGDGKYTPEPFFDILLTFDFAFNDLECSSLHPYFPKRLQHVKPLKRPVDDCNDLQSFMPNKSLKPSPFTLVSVLEAICVVPTVEVPVFIDHVESDLLAHADCFMSLQVSPTFLSQSIYVTGRYVKLCRNLPQSAWSADDADADDVTVEQSGAYSIARYSTSIEQLIGDPLVAATGSSGFRFSAAGREDVDVRMLGAGRPFSIQLLNPKVPFALSSTGISEASLNSSLLNYNLQISCLAENFTRTTLDLLKHGEGQKEKEYTAVCFIRGNVNSLPNIEEVCQKINSTPCPLALNQRTPIRVLHRRSPTIRKRHILSLKATPYSSSNTSHAFILRLRTEAGTYVKEFVHGDFGRTVPSIAQLLSVTDSFQYNQASCECDIVILDVTDVVEIKPDTSVS